MLRGFIVVTSVRVGSWCIQWMLYIVTEGLFLVYTVDYIYINISEGWFLVYTVDVIYSNRGFVPGVYSGLYIY